MLVSSGKCLKIGQHCDESAMSQRMITLPFLFNSKNIMGAFSSALHFTLSKTNVATEEWWRLLLLLRYAVSRMLFLFLGSIYASCQENQSFQNVKFRTTNARQFTAMPPSKRFCDMALLSGWGHPSWDGSTVDTKGGTTGALYSFF